MRSLQPTMFIQRQNEAKQAFLTSHEAKQALLTLGRAFKQHAYMLLQNLQVCEVKTESEFNISMICGEGADAAQEFLESESKKWDSVHHPARPVVQFANTPPNSCFFIRKHGPPARPTPRFVLTGFHYFFSRFYLKTCDKVFSRI